MQRIVGDGEDCGRCRGLWEMERIVGDAEDCERWRGHGQHAKLHLQPSASEKPANHLLLLPQSNTCLVYLSAHCSTYPTSSSTLPSISLCPAQHISLIFLKRAPGGV